jgi:hypothetical protein
MTTRIPDKPDIAAPTMNGKMESMTTETPTVIDFNSAAKEREPFLDRLPQRWELIAGLVGVSVALATTVTVVTNLIVRRRVETGRIVGFRAVRRYGMRHVQTPRGGAAWVAYLYRTPDLRVRLPIRK